ncbi:cyclin-dependent kinase-related kinase [Babesia ovis]|uniref:Cyclin-dependent kinase 2 homolog n=1 Tax=Babesia ovis TaxID=5869 RepID=A0A9W5TAP1_BABOV|nr:cyclin-dependent kinase-related kinase [Babesia ovis]
MATLMNLLYGDLEYPTRLNVRSHQNYVKVRNDKVSAEFIGKGRYCDPGAIQTETPVPKDCVLYYFEVEIVNSAKPSKIVLGFSNRNARLNRNPGTEQGSVGYKGENGNYSNGNARWEAYGSPYEKGDVIGCGINYVNQCYFFTRNGIFQGQTGQLHHCDNFPTVGLSQHVDTVKCNFEGPFIFDIRREYRRILAAERREINNQHIGNVNLDDIIQLYLLHRGYKKTMESFKRERDCSTKVHTTSDNTVGLPPPEKKPAIDMDIAQQQELEQDNSQTAWSPQFYITDEVIQRMEYTLPVRHQLHQLIIQGHILEAIYLIDKSFPGVNKSSFSYCRLLHQQFLEMVLRGKVLEAVTWLRESYNFNLNNKQPYKRLLEETTSILCHRDHTLHSVREKYGEGRRLSVASAINDLVNADLLKRFQPLGKHLGEGTYGTVSMYLDTLTGRNVAIKKVKNIEWKGERQVVGMVGIHFTTLRELKIMRELHHPNLMDLVAVYVSQGFINIVMELMAGDLKKVIDSKIRLNVSQQKCIMWQLLKGLEELHSCNFVHRDLSPANVFITDGGVLKIADFGLARKCVYSPMVPPTSKRINPVDLDKYCIREKMTYRVVTLWYRSPELLLGAESYHFACDMWSAGCIFAEVLDQKPLFTGTNEIDQLGRIYKVMGTPSDTNWPNAKKLKLYTPFTVETPKGLGTVIKGRSTEEIDLLQKMLSLDPKERITAKEVNALSHEYFTKPPLMCKPEQLPFDFVVAKKSATKVKEENIKAA